MADLHVSFVGLDLRNPFLIGAGPNTTGGGQISKNAERIGKAGWAGIVTKTIVAEDHPLARGLPHHLWPLSGKKLRRIGMQNLGPAMQPFSEDIVKKGIKAAKKAGLIVVTSIMGRTLDEWGSLARSMEEFGADAIELNVSCPAPFADIQRLPMHISQDPELLDTLVRAIKKKSGLPIIPKLTANVANIGSIAKAAEESGASAVSAINTVLGLAGVDIETGIPISSDLDGNAIFSGLSGPIIKPVGLRCVAQIAKAVRIPISGIGGIHDWESAAEYVMVGASTLQVCTGVMWRGFNVVQELTNGLAGFMERKGYKTLEEFKGVALKHFVEDHLAMDVTSKVVSVIDETKCTGCRLCVTACDEGAYSAITMKNDIAVSDRNTCTGCGLCGIVCPVPDCITYTRIPSRQR